MYALVVCVVGVCGFWFFFFFNQKTAYEMRISDWSSDVCSSDLHALVVHQPPRLPQLQMDHPHAVALVPLRQGHDSLSQRHVAIRARRIAIRSEEHTSELQSLMRISYAVFCLKKKKTTQKIQHRLTYLHTIIKQTTTRTVQQYFRNSTQ